MPPDVPAQQGDNLLRPLYRISPERIQEISGDLVTLRVLGGMAVATLGDLSLSARLDEQLLAIDTELTALRKGGRDWETRIEAASIGIGSLREQSERSLLGIPADRVLEVFQRQLLPSYSTLTASYEILRATPFRGVMSGFAGSEPDTFKRLQKTALPAMMVEYYNVPASHAELQDIIIHFSQQAGAGDLPLSRIIGELRGIGEDDFDTVSQDQRLHKILFKKYLYEHPTASVAIIHTAEQLQRVGSSLLVNLHSDLAVLEGSAKIRSESTAQQRLSGLRDQLTTSTTPETVAAKIESALETIRSEHREKARPSVITSIQSKAQVDRLRLRLLDFKYSLLTIDVLDKYHLEHEQGKAAEIVQKQVGKLKSVLANGDSKDIAFTLSQLYDWYNEGISEDMKEYIKANIQGSDEFFDRLGKMRHGIVHSVDELERKHMVDGVLAASETLGVLQGIAQEAIASLSAFQERLQAQEEIRFFDVLRDGEKTPRILAGERVAIDVGILQSLPEQINPQHEAGAAPAQLEPMVKFNQHLQAFRELMDELELGEIPEDRKLDIKATRITAMLGQSFKSLVDFLGQQEPELVVESSLTPQQIEDIVEFGKQSILFRDSLAHGGYLDTKIFQNLIRDYEVIRRDIMTLEQDVTRQHQTMLEIAIPSTLVSPAAASATVRAILERGEGAGVLENLARALTPVSGEQGSTPTQIPKSVDRGSSSHIR